MRRDSVRRSPSCGFRPSLSVGVVDAAGDDDAHALSADLLEDAAPYHADDLVEHFADDAPPEERVQARTKDARGLIDTAPGRAWQRACQAMRLLGDPQLPNGVSDESVRIEARTTLLATAARLLVDGVPAAVRRHEVVNMAGEAIVLFGASDRYAQALHALDAWTQAPQTAPFALLDATLALDSDGSWLRQALPPVAQRLRDAVEAFAGKPAEAAAYAGDVEGWLKLTGYAGDAAATARALRCQAVEASPRRPHPEAPARRSPRPVWPPGGAAPTGFGPWPGPRPPAVAASSSARTPRGCARMAPSCRRRPPSPCVGSLRGVASVRGGTPVGVFGFSMPGCSTSCGFRCWWSRSGRSDRLPGFVACRSKHRVRAGVLLASEERFEGEIPLEGELGPRKGQ